MAVARQIILFFFFGSFCKEQIVDIVDRNSVSQPVACRVSKDRPQQKSTFWSTARKKYPKGTGERHAPRCFLRGVTEGCLPSRLDPPPTMRVQPPPSPLGSFHSSLESQEAERQGGSPSVTCTRSPCPLSHSPPLFHKIKSQGLQTLGVPTITRVAERKDKGRGGLERGAPENSAPDGFFCLT